MTNKRKWFETFHPLNKGDQTITLGNGQIVYVVRHGNIRIESIVKGKKLKSILINTLDVSDISKNLFSIDSCTQDAAKRQCDNAANHCSLLRVKN